MQQTSTMTDTQILDAIQEYGLTVERLSVSCIIGHKHCAAKRPLTQSCDYRDVFAASVREGVAAWIERYARYCN